MLPAVIVVFVVVWTVEELVIVEIAVETSIPLSGDVTEEGLPRPLLFKLFTRRLNLPLFESESNSGEETDAFLAVVFFVDDNGGIDLIEYDDAEI